MVCFMFIAVLKSGRCFKRFLEGVASFSPRVVRVSARASLVVVAMLPPPSRHTLPHPHNKSAGPCFGSGISLKV